MDQQQKISKLYSVLESMEVSLGGGGGFEGFYGSVTANGVARVYESMGQHCRFDSSSFLVDVGGGLGRPLVHALVQPGVKHAVGLEVDEIKCMKSESVIRHALGIAKELSGCESCTEPRVLHKDVEKVNGAGTLDPATHAYTFWEGIPAKARTAFGELFARSSTLCCIAIVQRAIRRQSPEEYMESLNFGSLQLMETLSGIHMSGSNRSFKAYVFKRTSALGQPYNGPVELRLDTQLHAPRLLQASLPRMLRSRRNPATATPAAKLTKNPAGSHVRVTLQGTSQPSASAVCDGANGKLPSSRTRAKDHTGDGLPKWTAPASKAAASALEVADIGQTLKPADLNAVVTSTTPAAAASKTHHEDARGMRRHRRGVTSEDKKKQKPKKHTQAASQEKSSTTQTPSYSRENCLECGDANLCTKTFLQSNSQISGSGVAPGSPGKRTTYPKQVSPAKKLCSPSKA